MRNRVSATYTHTTGGKFGWQRPWLKRTPPSFLKLPHTAEKILLMCLLTEQIFFMYVSEARVDPCKQWWSLPDRVLGECTRSDVTLVWCSLACSPWVRTISTSASVCSLYLCFGLTTMQSKQPCQHATMMFVDESLWPLRLQAPELYISVQSGARVLIAKVYWDGEGLQRDVICIYGHQ